MAAQEPRGWFLDHTYLDYSDPRDVNKSMSVRGPGRNICGSGYKKGHNTDALFENEFIYQGAGEPYIDGEKIKKSMLPHTSKKYFKHSSPTKRGRDGLFDPSVMLVERPNDEWLSHSFHPQQPPNVVTANSSKGGPGYANRSIGGTNFEYIPEEFRDANDLKNEHNRKTRPTVPFFAGSKTDGYFQKRIPTGRQGSAPARIDPSTVPKPKVKPFLSAGPMKRGYNKVHNPPAVREPYNPNFSGYKARSSAQVRPWIPTYNFKSQRQMAIPATDGKPWQDYRRECL